MPVEPRGVPVPSVPPAPLAAPTAETGVPAAQPARPDEAAPHVEALGDRIADLAARIQAATYELLVLIRQFDERGGWEGFASCADWLSWRIGLAPGAAREKVRVAHALAKLPRLSEALRCGAVSYSKVRAVTRVATPATEQALLDVALAGTAAHVEQVVRTWRRVDRAAEQAEDRRRHESRALHTWVDDDGMVVVRGRLTPEVGAVLRRALDAALDAGAGATEPAAGADAAADGEPRATGPDATTPHAAVPDATALDATAPDATAPDAAAGATVGAEAASGKPPARWPPPSRSGGPMRWGCWPSARWPAGSTRGRPATATRWSSTSTPTPWRTTVSRARLLRPPRGLTTLPTRRASRSERSPSTLRPPPGLATPPTSMALLSTAPSTIATRSMARLPAGPASRPPAVATPQVVAPRRRRRTTFQRERTRGARGRSPPPRTRRPPRCRTARPRPSPTTLTDRLGGTAPLAPAPPAASRPSTRRAASTSPRRRPGGWPATPRP